MKTEPFVLLAFVARFIVIFVQFEAIPCDLVGCSLVLQVLRLF